MNEVIELKTLDNYQIGLKFNDGEEKVLNFRHYIGKGLQQNCSILKNLNRYLVDAGGGITWENGYDFCSYNE